MQWKESFHIPDGNSPIEEGIRMASSRGDRATPRQREAVPSEARKNTHPYQMTVARARDAEPNRIATTSPRVASSSVPTTATTTPREGGCHVKVPFMLIYAGLIEQVAKEKRFNSRLLHNREDDGAVPVELGRLLDHRLDLG